MSSEAVVAEAPVAESATKPDTESDPLTVKSAETANHVSSVAGGDEPAAKKAKTVVEENGEVKEKTPKKKVSQLERTRAEAEALIGDLKKESGGESGGRRTRSQTRGTPAKSVVPEKPVRTPRTPKAKTESPAAAAPKKTPAAGGGRSRGRPAKKAAAPSADEENGASEAAGDAAETDVAADDVKADEVEKKDPVVAENGQKSSDSQESSGSQKTESKEKEPEAESASKEVEKSVEPTPESDGKTDEPTPATAAVTAE